MVGPRAHTHTHWPYKGLPLQPVGLKLYIPDTQWSQVILGWQGYCHLAGHTQYSVNPGGWHSHAGRRKNKIR